MKPRWLWLGLLFAWALSHASVFGQDERVRTPAEKIRQTLDKTITVDFTGQSLNAAIEHLRDKANLPISIDQVTLARTGITPEENGQVEIKAKNEKAGHVLRKVLNSYRLAYVILDDALLITTEEVATQRQFRQRINIDIIDVPFRKAVRDLGRSHGINIIFDPRIARKHDAAVTLQLDSVPLETTVRILAELADVKSVRMGNVLFITNEERADKIRKEDPPLPDAFEAFGAGELRIGDMVPAANRINRAVPQNAPAPAAPIDPAAPPQ